MKTRIKIYITALLLSLIAVNTFAQVGNPPDKPLAPQEWINQMGIGSWWIFNIPPEKDNRIKVNNYSEQILDSLQSMCINGGRLHWQARDMFDPKTGFLLQEPIDKLHEIIDDFMERDMAICLNVDFLAKGFKMDAPQRQRILNGWTQLSDEFKDKSHLLAMSPVIEWHGWHDLDSDVRRDSLNRFYDELTVIFREKNPTRIMSYKPWGSAKHAEFETLDYPFGNDPLPSSGKPFYYVSSCSGSYGMGEWSKWHPNMSTDSLQILKEQTMNAGKPSKRVLGLNSAIKHRKETGIPFWIDHWSPNLWKNAKKEFPTKWTVEQNLAYVSCFLDILKEIGTAGAGIQTGKLWDDVANEPIRPKDSGGKHFSKENNTFSVEIIKLLKSKCDNTQ